jgi:hypothetical protein
MFPRLGRTARTAETSRPKRASFERLATDRMIARRRVVKLQFDTAVHRGRGSRRFEARAHVIQANARGNLRDHADRTFAGDSNVAAALNARRQYKPASDQRMFLSGAERGGISPEGFENGVRALKRIDAKFRHAKINEPQFRLASSVRTRPLGPCRAAESVVSPSGLRRSHGLAFCRLTLR